MLGAVIASKLTLNLRTTNAVGANANLVPSIRFNGSSGWSEWMPMSSFYVDSRKYKSGVYTLTCYDKLITAEQDYNTALYYPTTQQAVFNEICTAPGLTQDASIVINAGYQVATKPLNYSMREGSVETGLLLSNKFSFKGGLRESSASPSYAPQRSEFPYVGSIKKAIQNIPTNISAAFKYAVAVITAVLPPIINIVPSMDIMTRIATAVAKYISGAASLVVPKMVDKTDFIHWPTAAVSVVQTGYVAFYWEWDHGLP